MSHQRLNKLILAAAAEGILPPDTQAEEVSHPWPIVLMAGLGAWLTAIPLLALMFWVFGDPLLQNDGFCYLLGGFMLAGAVAILRNRDVTVFVEQLSFPALLAGGSLVVLKLFQFFPSLFAGALATIIVCTVAWLVPREGLRALLGAIACGTFLAASDFVRRQEMLWGAIDAAVIIWLLAVAVSDFKKTGGDDADHMAALESAATGWILFVLLALDITSGTTFLADPLLGHWTGLMYDGPTQKLLSLAMAATGAAWMLYRWPAVRTPAAMLSVAMLVALSTLAPTLGASLLVLVVCVTSHRWRLAVASAIAAAWVTGSFYYQLDLPLATKAVIMVGIGIVLGAAGWASWRERLAAASALKIAAPDSRRQQAAIVASLLAILMVVNIAIWRKEQLISSGRPVFIELAPADPRSLVEGDYMALNFRTPALEQSDVPSQRPVILIAKLDAREVAVLQALDTGRALAHDEIRVELLLTSWGLRPFSNAWYFKEGEATRWAKARYGEFRIDDKGHAMLVDLRGPNLEKL